MLDGEVVGEIHHVLLDRVDIRLHRLGHVHHEHDIDRAALTYAAEIENLGQLAILEDLQIIGAQIAHRLAVLIGQSEVEFDAAVRVEVLQAGIADHDLHRGTRGRGRAQLKNEQRGQGQCGAGRD